MKKRIDAKEAIELIRDGATDQDIMQQFNLSARGVESLKSKLLKGGLIDKREMDLLRGDAVSTLIVDMWSCPACGYPQPESHETCPQCGVIVSRYRDKKSTLADHTMVLIGNVQMQVSQDGKCIIVDGLPPRLQRKLAGIIKGVVSKDLMTV